MKRLLFLLIIFIIISAIIYQQVKEKVKTDLNQPVSYPSETPNPTMLPHQGGAITTAVFVPYWTLSQAQDLSGFDQYIYFGVTPTEQGISMSDATMRSLQQFMNNAPADKRKLLTISMTNNQANFAILKNSSAQKKIIVDALSLAQQEGFNGIVLDLEVSGIPFTSLEEQITSFTQSFASASKKQSLSFAITLYGDTFYRIRPFDVKGIAKGVDKVWIMAYDFHKARSNPGPNFPLHGNNQYGYDMTDMTDDFLQLVPAERTGVVFGMFGYDWIVDDKGNAQQQAVPLTDQQIQQKFLNGCQFANCTIRRDATSSETVIYYTDDSGN